MLLSSSHATPPSSPSIKTKPGRGRRRRKRGGRKRGPFLLFACFRLPAAEQETFMTSYDPNPTHLTRDNTKQSTPPCTNSSPDSNPEKITHISFSSESSSSNSSSGGSSSSRWGAASKNIHGGEGRMGPVAGIGILSVTVLITVVWGRVFAVIVICACCYLLRRLRRSAEVEVGGDGRRGGEEDLSSEEYKRRVVLHGLLQRPTHHHHHHLHDAVIALATTTVVFY